MRIFAPNFQRWVQCAKCSRHPRALKFLPKRFYTNAHTFQGAAKIFEKKMFFRYALLPNVTIYIIIIIVYFRLEVHLKIREKLNTPTA